MLVTELNFRSIAVVQRLLLSFVAVASLAGCVAEDPLACDVDNICSDADKPFCDVDGVYPLSNGLRFTCIPRPESVYCEEQAQSCFEGVQYNCSAGELSVTTSCAFGCDKEHSECSGAFYSGVEGAESLGQVIDISEPAVVDTLRAVIRTDSGVEIEFNDSMSIPGVNGSVPKLVVRVSSWTSGAILLEGAPALVIVSDYDIVLNDTFDVGASGRASQSICGDAWGVVDAGGGFGGAGGRGSTSVSYSGTSGVARMSPLRGGCGNRSAGAIHFATRGNVVINRGIINAAGFGGQSIVVNTFETAITPGGSGGGVLIEANDIKFAAGSGISANGGSGACLPVTSPFNPPVYFHGNRGTLDPAGTPPPNGCVAGRGGGSMPLDGGSQVGNGSAGGGAGRIRINTPKGQDWHAEGIITPAPSTGTLRLQ